MTLLCGWVSFLVCVCVCVGVGVCVSLCGCGCASVCGCVGAGLPQNFNLEIVSKLILRDKSVQKTALTADQCLRRLSEPDAAAFVVPALAYATDKALRFNFVFKSAMLQKCVYSTMLFTQREKFHQQAALLYEYQMTSETRAQLLPLIHYHYERTHNIIKRIEYLELVAEMHMANNSFADGTHPPSLPHTVAYGPLCLPADTTLVCPWVCMCVFSWSECESVVYAPD